MKEVFAFVMLCGCLVLAACGNSDYGESDLMTSSTSCHQKFYKRAYNKPYEIKGKTYHPQKHYEYRAEGLASYYGGGDVFHGRKTSNGEVFDMHMLSAAHKTIPIPAVVLVTNLENGRALKLKINDRGPFKDGRIIDVSRKAARMLGFEHKGLVKVRVETLVSESIVLADNMANGSRRSLLPHDQQIMLADTSNSKRLPKHNRIPHTMHVAQQIIIPNESNPEALNAEHDHQQLYLHPSLYSRKKLPNISLATRNQSSKKSRRSNIKMLADMAMIKPNNPRNFFIQTGTFNRFTNAQKLMTMVNSNSPKIKVKMQPVKRNNQQMFRVLVGPFTKKSQAHFYVDKLKNFDKRSSIVTN